MNEIITPFVVKHITEEQQDSIEVSKNSRGFTYSLKIFGDTKTYEGTRKLINKINELITILEERYGRNETKITLKEK